MALLMQWNRPRCKEMTMAFSGNPIGFGHAQDFPSPEAYQPQADERLHRSHRMAARHGPDEESYRFALLLPPSEVRARLAARTERPLQLVDEVSRMLATMIKRLNEVPSAYAGARSRSL
jgi:hypothetical protein